MSSLSHAQKKVSGSKPLWETWKTYFGSTEWAAARALTVLNKWAKEPDCPKKEQIYRLKDVWVRQHLGRLTSAEFVREEYKYGRDQTLYCHTFDIEGKDVCFHSYRKPKEVAGLKVEFGALPKGRDLPSYGTPLDHEKVRELPLTLPQIYRALEYFLVTTYG